MAQYGKNNYFDGVILPEPEEEMLRRMAKGVDASKGYLESTDAGLLFDGPRSMECFFNLRQSDGTQRPAQFSTSMLAIAVTPMDAIMFHCGNKSLQVSRATIGDDIHAVISYDGATAMCYINGIEVGAMQPTAYTPSALFRIGDPLHITKSPVHFCRHFNYALSAEEVAAHYNNGDPMGYVVPKASRYFEKSYQSNFTDGTDGWTGYGSSSGLLIESKEGILEISGDYANYQIRMPYPPAPKCASRYKMRVEFAEPVSISRYALYAFTGNSAFQENVTEPKTILDGVTPLDNNLSQYCYIYLYGITPNTVVHIKSVTIEPAGLLAEYLPQNLIPTAESSVVQWLDSAPQLPEANGILPPLDASVGGYDLAAIGNPKIVV